MLDRHSMTRIEVMTTRSLAAVKAHFSAVVEDVHNTHERVIVTRNGQAAVAIVAVEDLEALEETLAILQSPATMRSLVEGERDVESGDVLDADELRALVARRAERRG